MSAGDAAGQPDTAPPRPPSQRPAQARAGTAEPTRPRVLAVDGSALLVRCSRAARARGIAASDGTPTGALMIFIGSLARKIRWVQPDYLVTAWDGQDSRAWRRELYPLYKANRALVAYMGREMIQAYEFCQAAGIAILDVPGFEADDLVAAVQRRVWYELPGAELVICSEDGDMLQLLDDSTHTTLSMLSSDVPVTAADVERDWGVSPGLLPRVRALAGDPSDNIPGVPGIGPKRAAQIIRTCREWPLPEQILPHKDIGGTDQRDLVSAWRTIMDLISPPRFPEDLVGEEYFRLRGAAEWHPAITGELLAVLERYELSALSDRAVKGRLW